MNDYVKPCIGENNPDHIIFHVETNDIATSKDPVAIAQYIVDLSKSVMTQDCSVAISGMCGIFRSLTIVNQLILEKISIIVNYI